MEIQLEKVDKDYFWVGIIDDYISVQIITKSSNWESYIEDFSCRVRSSKNEKVIYDIQIYKEDWEITKWYKSRIKSELMKTLYKKYKLVWRE